MHVFNHIDCHTTHIFAITESWLNSSITDSFLLPSSSHRLYRCDDASDKRQRGVAAYISTKLNAIQLDNEIQNTLTLYLPTLELYLAIIYRPPRTHINQDRRLMEFIDNFAYGRNVAIMGDFNLPSLKWCSGIEDIDTSSSARDRSFLDCFARNGLTQIVTEPTHKAGATLDLILLSQPDYLITTSVSCPLPSCDHSPVNARLSYSVTPDPNYAGPTKLDSIESIGPKETTSPSTSASTALNGTTIFYTEMRMSALTISYVLPTP